MFKESEIEKESGERKCERIKLPFGQAGEKMVMGNVLWSRVLYIAELKLNHE